MAHNKIAPAPEGYIERTMKTKAALKIRLLIRCCIPLIFAAALFSCSSIKKNGEERFENIADAKLIRYTDSIKNIKATDSAKLINISLLKQLLAGHPLQSDSPNYAQVALNIGIIFSSIHGNDGSTTIEGMEDSTYEYASSAFLYFKNHPQFEEQQALCYSKMGWALTYGGHSTDLDYMYRANTYNSKAAAICALAEQKFKPAFLLSTYANATVSNRICQQYEKALLYGQKAVAAALNRNNKLPDVAVVKAALEIAPVFAEMHQFDSAKKYIQLVEGINDTAHNDHYKRNIDFTWSLYYGEAGKIDSAIKYSLATTMADEKQADLFDKLTDYISNAAFYCQLHNRQEAFAYLKKSDSLISAGYKDSLALEIQADLLSAKTNYAVLYGNKEEAFTLLSRLLETKKAFYNKERLRMFTSIEAEYDVAQKEKLITTLNAQNNITAVQVKQKNTMLLLFAALAALLLSVIIMSVINLRRKKLEAEKKDLIAANKQIELEQRLLLSQMNPHFMYNALSAIQSEILSGNSKLANLYLNKYAELTRLILESSRKNTLSLPTEVLILQNYLLLQKIRFDEKFDYKIEVYKGYGHDNAEIPPMLIQPFVENAVEHGFAAIAYKGELNISIMKDAGFLLCIIKDNGAGLQEKETKPDKQSLSTDIVKERLLHLNKNATVTISNRNDGIAGVVVTLKIPIQHYAS